LADLQNFMGLKLINIILVMDLSKNEQDRYQKHILLPQIGIAGQLKLKQARVLVIGAGGLGCPVLLYLVSAGVGHIGIADDDVVSLSNLQRQVLYTTDSIGRSKAEGSQRKAPGHEPGRTDYDVCYALLCKKCLCPAERL
jgi:tRNA A37 threonylcarbamoyladenosine dehydratase